MASKGSTEPGYVNRNGQINLGRTNPRRRGSDHLQYVYVMHCPVCVYNYGANGSDIHLRLCPNHWQDGRIGMPGEPLQGDEWALRP